VYKSIYGPESINPEAEDPEINERLGSLRE
jgi:hypothetical protein